MLRRCRRHLCNILSVTTYIKEKLGSVLTGPWPSAAGLRAALAVSAGAAAGRRHSGGDVRGRRRAIGGHRTNGHRNGSCCAAYRARRTEATTIGRKKKTILNGTHESSSKKTTLCAFPFARSAEKRKPTATDPTRNTNHNTKTGLKNRSGRATPVVNRCVCRRRRRHHHSDRYLQSPPLPTETDSPEPHVLSCAPTLCVCLRVCVCVSSSRHAR